MALELQFAAFYLVVNSQCARVCVPNNAGLGVLCADDCGQRRRLRKDQRSEIRPPHNRRRRLAVQPALPPGRRDVRRALGASATKPAPSGNKIRRRINAL